VFWIPQTKTNKHQSASAIPLKHKQLKIVGLYCTARGGVGVQEVASSDFGAWFRLPWSVPVLHGHGKLQMKGA
jgi:hypothetical protein